MENCKSSKTGSSEVVLQEIDKKIEEGRILQKINGKIQEEELTVSEKIQNFEEMSGNPPGKNKSNLDPSHKIKKIDNQINIDTFRFYKKTPAGATEDHGKKYERAMCILYALKLITNDSVVDFSMTSNNTDCGLFDDIELDVTFKDEKRRIFLMQLKYKEDRESIDQNMLTKQTQKKNNKQQKNKFYLPNYLEAIFNLGIHHDRDVINILYTNRPVKLKKGQKILSFKSYALKVMTWNHIANREVLVNTQSQEDIIFHFEPDVGTEFADNEKLEKACKQFYILSEQDDLKTVEANIKEKLTTLLHSDVYSSFNDFMKNWWSDNFALTKHHVISKLAELALSPYIRTLSAEKSNERTQLLEEAIMKFEITLVEDIQEDLVMNIWTETNTAYDWTSSPLQKFFDSSSATQISKILWFLGKAPLVVKFDMSSATTVKSVLILLQKDNHLNRVVLLGDAKKVDFNQRKVFENLTDLEKNFGNSQFYNNLISNFNVSFQDRGCMSLGKLSAIDETITTLIGTTELLKMSQTDHFMIGNGKEKLPPFYIPRCVSTYLMNIDEVLNLYKLGRDNVVIINCDADMKEKLQMQNVQVVQVSEYLTKGSEDETIKSILISTSNRCTRVQFGEICQKFHKSNVYVFQVKPNDECSLLLMEGRKLFLKKRLIEEQYILHHFDNPINVFCASPGMGKSSLMKVLNNNTPSDFWAIHVELINYNSFLAEKPNYETIVSRFLKVDQCEGRLTTQIKETLWRSKKVYIFLDGLDEVDSDHLDLVFEFAKTVSSDGFNVWISSRENLREKINQELEVEPIEIEELDEKQQHHFIQSKLEKKHSEEKVEKIVKAVYESVDINNSKNLLGIPLQLHIITEMFLNNEEAYTNLEQQSIFVLTHMYKLFFQGNVKRALKKLGLDESSKAQLGIKDEEILEKYELPALKSCLDHSDYERLDVNLENIPTSIKYQGDKFGIIKSVNENNDEVVFNHQTYAEYFACKWFRKHKDRVKMFNNRIFSRRYKNLRRIFDIMMAENSPLHLAVIHENIDQFNKYIGDLEKVDDGGRTALHLACSYGTKCDTSLYEHGYYGRRQRESVPYLEMMEKLVHPDVDIYAKDDLFDFSCVDYATESKCLYPIEKMLEKNLIPSKKLYTEVCKYDNIEALAFYATRFGYPSLLCEILKFDPKLVHHRRRNKSFLKIAVLGIKSDDCLKPRNGNVEAVKVLVAFGANFKERFYESSLEDPLNLLDIACRELRYDMIKLLIEMGLRCTLGNTVLHRMLQADKLDSDTENVVLKIVENLKIDINTQNYDGITALQIACSQTHFAMIDALFEMGADPNIKDELNNTTLHYAYRFYRSQYFHFLDMRTLIFLTNLGIGRNAHSGYFDEISIQIIIRLLISRGIDVNTQNFAGVSPLQLAGERGHTEVVKILLEKGADPHVVDNKNRNVLHYVLNSQKPKTEIIDLLISRGVDVNAETSNGTGNNTITTCI